MGVIRLKAPGARRQARLPVIAVNEARTKHSSTTATARSADDRRDHPRDQRPSPASASWSPATWTRGGRDVHDGAHAIVTEVDPMRGFEATMDGYEVPDGAQRRSATFCTATGDKNVITLRAHGVDRTAPSSRTRSLQRRDRDRRARDLAVETRRRARSSTSSRWRRPSHLPDRRGAAVNLAAAEGHPAPARGMSFANQALAAEWVIRNAATSSVGSTTPKDIDEEIARLKLATMEIEIDTPHGGTGALPRFVGRRDVEGHRLRIFIWHATSWVARGRTSTPAQLAREWSRGGHDVTVFSQEARPEQYDLGEATPCDRMSAACSLCSSSTGTRATRSSG